MIYSLIQRILGLIPFPSVAEEEEPQEAHPAEAFPTETVKALAQALEDAQATGGRVDALAEAVADGETIKTEIIGDGAMGRVIVITAEPENTEATVQLESDEPAKKPMGKGRGMKGAVATEGVSK